MPAKIEGEIVAIAENGNLISDIGEDQLRGVPRGDAVSVVCDEHETHGIFDPEHNQPESTFLAVLGSSGYLELEIVGVSASVMLGIGIGQKVILRW